MNKDIIIWNSVLETPHPGKVNKFITKNLLIFEWCPCHCHTPPYRNGFYCRKIDKLWSEIEPIEWANWDDYYKYLLTLPGKVEKLENLLRKYQNTFENSGNMGALAKQIKDDTDKIMENNNAE